MIKRTETILFITLAAGVYVLAYLQLDEVSFLYAVGQWLIYFIFGLTMLFGVYRVLRDKRPLPILIKFKPLFLAVLFILSFFIVEYLIMTDGKRVVLSAGHNGDLNFIRLDLRSDNTFKLTNSGPFGGSIYRGNYKLQNDTLRIDNLNLKYLYPSLTFIMKQSEDKRKYFEPINPDTTKFKYALYLQSPYYARD